MAHDDPFTLNLFHGVPAKYASLSGTSMSAAFVAGAAARTWSLAGMGNAANVKERLLQGSSLGFGSDLNTDLGFDPARGYNDGEFFNFMDTETYDQIRATQELVGDRAGCQRLVELARELGELGEMGPHDRQRGRPTPDAGQNT